MEIEPIRLTVEEFEILLFEVYKHGFRLGTHTHSNNMSADPYEHTLKEKFDKLMYDLKLRTTLKP